MVQYTYSLSPATHHLLKEIAGLRDNILLVTVNPARERYLRFEATKKRLSCINPRSVETDPSRLFSGLFSTGSRKGNDKSIQIYHNYALTLSRVREDWTGNSLPITVSDVEQIDEWLRYRRAALPQSNRIDPPNLKTLLTWLQTVGEHPVVTAGLAYAGISAFLGIKLHPLSIAVMYAFLCKSGYYLRGFAAVEHEMARHPREYESSFTPFQADGNASPFIDFYAGCSLREIGSVARETESAGSQKQNREFILTNRQHEILLLSENPGTRITNRMVKDRLNLSQVTVSRELSRLTALGLLAPHGKGRSVYYTRV